MDRIIHVTNAHAKDDPRIYSRHCQSLAKAGYQVIYIGPFENFSNESHTRSKVKLVTVEKPRGRLERFTVTNFKLFLRIIRSKSVLVEFHDPDFIFWACLLKIFGYKCIANIHEDISRQVLNKYWLYKPLRKTLYWALRLFFPFAVNNVCSARVCATETIQTLFKDENTEVCRNFPARDFYLFRQKNDRSTAETLKLIYVGVVEERRGLEVMLNLLDNPLVSELHLVGKFSPLSLQEKTQKYQNMSPKLKVHGEVPYCRVSEYIDKCDVGLCFLESNPAYQNAIPTKIFEYIARGKPVIANNYPPTASLCKERMFGILVDDMKKQTIENALNKMSNNYESYASAATAAAKRFSWANEEKKYLDLVRRVL